jgi:hypothetical protein
MCDALVPAKDRFPSVQRLLAVLDQRVAAALWDRAFFRQFNETHNEACTAVELLRAPSVAMIDYEPKVGGSEKRLDFSVHFQDGRRAWVEVKTIDPTDQDDWDKFQAARDKGRFPRNVNVILVEGMMGGEIYHDHYSSRTKILEHVVDTEARLAECRIDPEVTPTTLAIAASPLKVPRDTLEDFTHFYRTGAHSQWDEFRDMEAHNIAQQQIRLVRTISKFAYVGRGTYEVWPREVDWDVRFPTAWIVES